MKEPRTVDTAVHVLALGGTIAMTDGAGGTGPGITPRLDADDLIAAVPELRDGPRIIATSVLQVPGGHLTGTDLIRVSDHIIRAAANGDGVVVVQGTDTIEETAFAWDLLYAGDAPLVVTGAMRAPESPGADGPANLLAAVRTAASTSARDMGALVLLDDTLHLARAVRKAHSSRPSAFVSGTIGNVGWIDEGRVRIPLRPRNRVHVPAPATRPVALHLVSLDDDGRALQELGALGYEGVVVSGLGVGHVPPGVADAVEGLAPDLPVLYASRTSAGGTYTSTYGYTGSEQDLLARGARPARGLDGPKARVLLSLALGAGWDLAQIERGADLLWS